MTHLSLFTGIGGLDIAAEWAGFETVGQCEWADYPTRVLERHWPDVERWRDVRDFTADEFARRTGVRAGELTLLTGGPPCQPFSIAGKRLASGDKRDMWPEYFRVVGDVRPRWCVAENVRGLLSADDGWYMRGILRQFADLGYAVAWGIIRACDAGAPHKRERVCIVAHSEGGAVRDDGENWEKTAREINASADAGISCGNDVEHARSAGRKEQHASSVAGGERYAAWGLSYDRCGRHRAREMRMELREVEWYAACARIHTEQEGS